MPTVAFNVVLQQRQILAGEELNARILVDSTDPETVVDEFYAEVLGEERTGWVNIHSDKIYEGEKVYMQVCIQLMGAKTALPIGRHHFPVRVNIPDDAPSSFDGDFGSVRYTIKLSLKTNTEQSTCNQTFPFTVVSRSYFDEIPANVFKNIKYNDQTDFTCCTLPFGTVSLTIDVPSTAIQRNETICCAVQVHNGTRKTLKLCRICLHLKTQFEATSRYERRTEKRFSEQIVDSVVLGDIRSRSRMEFNNCCLKVSDSYPPTMVDDRDTPDPHIIMHHYVLTFTALPGIETEIPLIVTSRGYRDQPRLPATTGDVTEDCKSIYLR